MDKLLLISVILAAVLVPARAARDPNPRRGLKRALWAMVVINVMYVAGLFYVLPRL